MHEWDSNGERLRIIYLYCKTLGDSRRIDADRKRKSVRQINNEYMRIEAVYKSRVSIHSASVVKKATRYL